MKAILTTVGEDQVGIIAGVSQKTRLTSWICHKRSWMATLQ